MKGIGVKLRILKKKLPILLIFLAVRWSRFELLCPSPYIRPPFHYGLFALGCLSETAFREKTRASLKIDKTHQEPTRFRKSY